MSEDVGVLMLEQLKGLRGDVTALHEDVRGTNARLDAVERTLQDLAAQMLILARFVRNIGDKYDQELESIKDRLDRVEGKLA